MRRAPHSAPSVAGYSSCDRTVAAALLIRLMESRVRRTRANPATHERMAGFNWVAPLSSPLGHTTELCVRRWLPMIRWSHAYWAPSSVLRHSMTYDERKRQSRAAAGHFLAFTREGAPVWAGALTALHRRFHAVLFSYDVLRDDRAIWFLESTDEDGRSGLEEIGAVGGKCDDGRAGIHHDLVLPVLMLELER